MFFKTCLSKHDTLLLPHTWHIRTHLHTHDVHQPFQHTVCIPWNTNWSPALKYVHTYGHCFLQGLASPSKSLYFLTPNAWDKQGERQRSLSLVLCINPNQPEHWVGTHTVLWHLGCLKSYPLPAVLVTNTETDLWTCICGWHWDRNNIIPDWLTKGDIGVSSQLPSSALCIPSLMGNPGSVPNPLNLRCSLGAWEGASQVSG